MKPTVVYTRPRDWFDGGYTSEKLNLIYVPISGDVPTKKNGRRAGDGIGDMITEKGVRTLYSVIKQHQPQVFFHSIHSKVDRRILKVVKGMCPKVLVVVNESNSPETLSPYVQYNRQWTDGVLLNSKDPDVKSKYCAIAYDPMMIGTFYDGFSPKDIVYVNRERDFDCFFGGSNHRMEGGQHRFPFGKFREKFIQMVADTFKLELHGSAKEWYGLNTSRVLSYPQYFPAFQNANIILGSNHFDLVRYYTRRTIHSGASGRLFLTRYIPEMEEDFVNKKHLVWFRSIEEGIDLIRYYLAHPDEREVIARQGRELFLARHTWKARLAEFENYVLKICS